MESKNDFKPFTGANVLTAREEYNHLIDVFKGKCQLSQVDYVLDDRTLFTDERMPDEDPPVEPEFENSDQEGVTVALRIEILKLNEDRLRSHERAKDKFHARMTKSLDDLGKAIAIFQQLLEYGSFAYSMFKFVRNQNLHPWVTLRRIQEDFDNKWSSGNDQTKDDIIDCLKAATDIECGDLQRLGTWMNLTTQLEVMGQLPDKDDLLRIFATGTKNEFVRTLVIVPNQMKLPSDRLGWKELATMIQEILDLNRDKILKPSEANDVASRPVAMVVANNAHTAPVEPKGKHCRYCGSYEHLANKCNADKCLNCNAPFSGYLDRKAHYNTLCPVRLARGDITNEQLEKLRRAPKSGGQQQKQSQK